MCTRNSRRPVSKCYPACKKGQSSLERARERLRRGSAWRGKVAFNTRERSPRERSPRERSPRELRYAANGQGDKEAVIVIASRSVGSLANPPRTPSASVHHVLLINSSMHSSRKLKRTVRTREVVPARSRRRRPRAVSILISGMYSSARTLSRSLAGR